MKKFVRLLFGLCFVLASSSAELKANAGLPPGLDNRLRTVDHYTGVEEMPNAVQQAVEFEPAVPQPQADVNNTVIPNSHYVFQSFRDNNWEIYTTDGDYTVQTNISNNSDSDIHPRLNRGATQIVFASKRSGKYEIYRMNVDGSGLLRLTVTANDNVYPDWSPDGNRIVFQSYRDGQPEIYVMNADGSNQTRLTNDPNYDGEPRWSPDGTQIAFASYRLAEGGIWIMGADGGYPHLAILGINASDPVWSPDGSQIAFATADTNAAGFLRLGVAGVNGANFHFLSYTGHYFPGIAFSEAWAGSWSPDGRYILFTEIGYIQNGGNWYWTQAFGSVYDTASSTATQQFAEDTLWNPDIQTTENQPPIVNLDVLPAVSEAAFTVNWSGVDQGPAGLLNFDVQVKELPFGNWTDWRPAIGYSSSTFKGQGGHTYTFRVRGRDQHGNVSNWVENPLAVTTVESKAPFISITAPAILSNGAVVNWQGEDVGGSGILGYDVQYRERTSLAWVAWQMGVQNTGARFTAEVGKQYFFRARATDQANNTSAWVESRIPTRICGLAVEGMALNNLGLPVSSAVISLAGSSDAPASSGLDGRFSLCSSLAASSYKLDWAAPGYGSLPSSTFGVSQTVAARLLFPPLDNIAVNGDFETGSLDGWTAAGSLPPVISASQFASGGYSAQLGKVSSGLSGKQALTDLLSHSYGGVSMINTPDGEVHLAYGEYNPNANGAKIYVQSRPLGGDWKPRVQIGNGNITYNIMKLYTDDHGGLYATYVFGMSIFLNQRTPQGDWGAQFNVAGGHQIYDMLVPPSGDIYFFINQSSTNESGGYLIYHRANQPYWRYKTNLNMLRFFSAAADERGTVNILGLKMEYTTHSSLLNFLRLEPNGVWEDTLTLDVVSLSTNSNGNFDNALIKAEPGGLLHALWTTNPDVKYSTRDLAGNWSPLQIIPNQNLLGDLMLSPTGTVSFIARDRVNYDRIYYNEKQPGGSWAEPVTIYSYTSGPSIQSAVSMLDTHGQIHVLIFFQKRYYYNQYIYIRRNTSGIWLPAQVILYESTSNGSVSLNPALTVDDNGQAHIAWNQIDNNYQGYFYYIGPDLSQNNDVSALQQTIQIPESSAPVLSFAYHLKTAAPGPAAFSVVVTSQLTQTMVFSTTQSGSGWTNASVDMAEFAGKTVTVTFALSQVPGQPAAWGFVDDISLGAGQSDVWVRSAPTAALPGRQVVYALAYGNQGGMPASGVIISHTMPSKMTFLSASLPVTLTGSTLTWDLGNLAAGSSGTIYITATLSAQIRLGSYLTGRTVINTPVFDPEQGNNAASLRIFVGRRVFLPAIMMR